MGALNWKEGRAAVMAPIPQFASTTNSSKNTDNHEKETNHSIGISKGDGRLSTLVFHLLVFPPGVFPKDHETLKYG
jgi:hypothetical protein